MVDGVADVGKELDDIKLKLDAIEDLPDGAGPIIFHKDFGDTAALMLTVASPKVAEAEVALRARALQRAIEETRKDRTGITAERVTLALGLPGTVSPNATRQTLEIFVEAATRDRVLQDVRRLEGSGFVGLDAETSMDDAAIAQYIQAFVRDRLRASEIHPDAWPPVLVRNPADAMTKLARGCGEQIQLPRA